jgi:hypothetical protein
MIDTIERFGEEPSRERREALVSMAAHSIKQFSKTGVKLEVIEKWVVEHFPPPEEMHTFIGNIPTTVLILISSGVLSFRLPERAAEAPNAT